MGRVSLGLLALTLFGFGYCPAQTTQGLITGRVRDQVSNAAVGSARIEYEQLNTNTHGISYAASDGNYYIPLLPPGSYRVRVTANGYQPREVYAMVVTVAGYLHINFDLRPLSDVWERRRYQSQVFRDNTILPFFGPDVDPSYTGTFEPERGIAGQLEPSISDVVDPTAIATLPLAGRDVYTALVLQPAVTADSTTTRSLGLSVNGQRPTSSNFLLDGVEENDALLSGPAVQLAPEMVQEYRVSTNNFSAEYGRTSGYIANAVTRSATAQWHGIAYGDWNNDVLNANTFQHNSVSLPRITSHQIEAGVSAGGGIPHSRLLTWTAIDYFGSRSFSDPTSYGLPTRAFIASLPSGSRAAQLLQQYPPVQVATSAAADIEPVILNVPVTLRRFTGLEKMDYAFSSRQHLTGRLLGAVLNRPDFYWSPYGDSPLSEKTIGVAMALTSQWSPTVLSEIRAGFQTNSRNWNLALADLPQIAGLGATDRPPFASISLPGSCCAQEGWHDNTRTSELAANLIFTRGIHLVKAGSGILDTRPHTGFQFPLVIDFAFASLTDFAHDQPYQFESVLSRTAGQQRIYEPPNTSRSYRYDQPYAFLQEDLRLTSRLTLNAGLRFDRFPAPVNVGPEPDVLVTLGPGSTLDRQIASAYLSAHTGSLFTIHPNNFSLRLGFSLAPFASRSTVVRGGYGTFYDRPPENYWLTASANDIYSGTFSNSACPLTGFYQSANAETLPASCSANPGKFNLFDATLFQTGLHAPRVQSFFLSVQQPIRKSLVFELDGTGSRGRSLLTTDVRNRINPEVSSATPSNGLPAIDYRTNQGFSDYTAFATSVRYRNGPATLSIAYTWSRSIDNQSDPLLGEYFDLGFSNQTDRTGRSYYGSFTFPGDTRSDRGNSDFDQRQNLVGWASFLLPGRRAGILAPLFRNWSTTAVFALRSGLPYTVYAGESNCQYLCNTRADLVSSAHATVNIPVNGGIQVLNPAAFGVPIGNRNGNIGRNAFEGPGFSNLDLSVSRSFDFSRLGENVHLTLRADAFNLLNHANLQNPEAFFADTPSAIDPQFGIARYGRTTSNSGFPALTPLIENAREVHILLRMEF
jgi:hypothetical protein